MFWSNLQRTIYWISNIQFIKVKKSIAMTDSDFTVSVYLGFKSSKWFYKLWMYNLILYFEFL